MKNINTSANSSSDSCHYLLCDYRWWSQITSKITSTTVIWDHIHNYDPWSHPQSWSRITNYSCDL